LEAKEVSEDFQQQDVRLSAECGSGEQPEKTKYFDLTNIQLTAKRNMKFRTSLAMSRSPPSYWSLLALGYRAGNRGVQTRPA